MRIFISAISFFLLFETYAQNQKAVNWINENAIKIEDANPDTNLTIFSNNIPQKFADAKIFGFGETTHQGKEFFDIKAKFFKYLVENQGIKVFIIEDSYTSEAGINEWISGGKGNAETIANNFSIGFWYCKEVVNLLEWMRNYNLNKTKDEQIRFYGMDIQDVKKINQEIQNLVKKYNIPISEELLLVVDNCVEKEVKYSGKTDWADIQIPKLNKIESILFDFRKGIKNENIYEFNLAIRALNYLSKYTYYVQNHHSQDRDLLMFENAKWIVENKSKNGKAFIWAHNEHINNKQAGNYSGRNIYNLGRHLKEYYKNDYYSVGFDFGTGTLAGYFSNKDEKPSWKKFELSEPFAKTYAETLIEAKDEIYFIDMSKALDGNSSNFFKGKNKQLVAGGGGFNFKNNHLYQKKFSEMYDGLIFVKNITLPTNILITK
ncbi:erythromycin esterase family protein [Flavobacterium sp. LS1P28]|uniref:erythromycin esterase family protein n=1 Tax=Flavobacterium sp. LS1P28 TaxID=2497752 RepID=UPI000F832C0D|nr:erythromycin esterase family protein [Flavobacterium sp. LS1P28]RTY80785.1 erythromycin esterase family protein [Flavobacterium sp. LS1P28]